MAISAQRHANVSKQATLLDGLDVSPLKWRVCGCDLNQFVHEGINHISNVKVQRKCKYEGMNHISNVKVHLKTRSGNVNISCCLISSVSRLNMHFYHNIQCGSRVISIFAKRP